MTAERRLHRRSDPAIDFDGRYPTVEAWVESLPEFEERPTMTCDGYLYLLRHMLAGGAVPYYTDPVDLWRDSLLAHTNEVFGLRRNLEFAQDQAARNQPTVERLWSLVWATGKRKTMRTEDVRAALESGRG